MNDCVKYLVHEEQRRAMHFVHLVQDTKQLYLCMLEPFGSPRSRSIGKLTFCWRKYLADVHDAAVELGVCRSRSRSRPAWCGDDAVAVVLGLRRRGAVATASRWWWWGRRGSGMEPSLCFSALSQIGSSLGPWKTEAWRTLIPVPPRHPFLFILGGPLASERARPPPIRVRERGLTQSLDWVRWDQPYILPLDLTLHF